MSLSGVVHLVDDDVMFRSALANVIELAGHTVLVYDSAGAFLIDYAPSTSPECAILDLQMPGPSGLDLHESLAAKGCRISALDITDEQSMVHAVCSIEADHGSVDVLVNNAGYGQQGAIEETSIGQFRNQFETNVFGAVRMCQLVLPAMRHRGRGRIVMVSSMGGRLTFPGGGAYHGSKFALEAISDVLRFEVAKFGEDYSQGIVTPIRGDAPSSPAVPRPWLRPRLQPLCWPRPRHSPRFRPPPTASTLSRSRATPHPT